MALTARHVVGDHDTIAHIEAGPARPGLDDVADHLVAEDRRAARRGRRDLRDIGAAQPAAAHPQQQLAGANGRPRQLDGNDAASGLDHRGPHAALPSRRSRAAAQRRSAMPTLRRADSVMRSPKTWKRRASISSSSAR